MATRRDFGAIQTRPTGYRASYIGPDGRRHRHPRQFSAKIDAEAWLVQQKRAIDAGTWESPEQVEERKAQEAASVVLFKDYATDWLAHRTLAPRTRAEYKRLLEAHLYPAFGATPLPSITVAMVKKWHTDMGAGKATTRARAYGLLRTLLHDAVREQLILQNPCVIRGAGSSSRKRNVVTLEPEDLDRLAKEMPDRLAAAVLVAGWCGLRFGELTELRRKDVDLKNGVIHIHRAVVRAEDDNPGKEYKACECRPHCWIGPPKTEAGSRTVRIPPHIVEALKGHIKEHALWGKDGLLFPSADGGHLPPVSLYGRKDQEVGKGKDKRVRKGWGFYAARDRIGRPDLKWHDLRHTVMVLYAQEGATTAELMAIAGHTTPDAAMRYQHAANKRLDDLAQRLSDRATGKGSA